MSELNQSRREFMKNAGLGVGLAGIGAALGSARTGRKTLLIDSCEFFGGVASWSLRMPINQMRPESKARSVVHELLIKKLLNYGDQAVHIGQHQCVVRQCRA